MMGFYLALDPGQSTGWATFTLLGKPIDMGVVAYSSDLYCFLQNLEPEFVVCEEFRLRTETTDKRTGKKLHFTPKWDKVVAARAIGMVEARTLELCIPLHMQQPSILPTASQAFGLPHKKAHQLDAALHGFYYAWRRLGILPPARSITVIEEAPSKTKVVTVTSLSEIAKAAKKQAR